MHARLLGAGCCGAPDRLVKVELVRPTDHVGGLARGTYDLCPLPHCIVHALALLAR